MKKNRKTIAFGTAGEGCGHAARTIALAEILKSSYDLVVFAPASIRDFLSENLDGIRIIEIPGISFHKENHVIRYRKTLLKNLTNIGRLQPEVELIMSAMKGFGVDALVSDFEPYTAIAASSLRLPVMNLNHPGIVLRYFSLKPDALAAKLAARIMMPSGTKELICSFYGGDIGPIIRREIKEGTIRTEDYFVVYTKDESREQLLQALKAFPGYSFRIFPDKSMNFTSALLGCRGVISSGGHQMLSEALFLKKPVLAFPQKMQFEQRLNAIMLERSGRGSYGDINRIEESLDRFLENIDSFPVRSANYDNFLFVDSTPAAAACIGEFVEQETAVPAKRYVGRHVRRKPGPFMVRTA